MRSGRRAGWRSVGRWAARVVAVAAAATVLLDVMPPVAGLVVAAFCVVPALTLLAPDPTG